jgi:hypothetical protein
MISAFYATPYSTENVRGEKNFKPRPVILARVDVRVDTFALYPMATVA